MKLQENIERIKQMMGLIKESENEDFDDLEDSLINKKNITPNEKLKVRTNYDSPYKPCKKCIGTYNGLMGDDCAYEAIERFEENYGTEDGTSMGNNYFEGNWKRYDQLIVNRITKLIGSSWDMMDNKFRMQLWSFMYNSDSSATDNYRWLAILYATANPDMTSYDTKITSKIIGKKDIKLWNEAVNVVSNFTGWNSKYNKFLEMIDGQYQTYSNKGAYENSWGKRPEVMSDMYDECFQK